MATTATTEQYTFQVQHILFAKDGFHIVRTASGDSVKGKFLAKVGYFYRGDGKWEENERYGPSFVLESAVAITPPDPASLGRFLVIAMKGKGVGDGVIGALVSACKEDGLNLEEMLDKNKRAELVDCVGTRNAKKVDLLLAEWPNIKPAADLISPLLGYGLSPAQADQLVALYGKNAIERVESDPYGLIVTLDGVSFLTADKIAMKVGRVTKKDPIRLRAALSTGIRDATVNGDVGVRRKTLIDKTMPLVNESIVENNRRKLAPGVTPEISQEMLLEMIEEMVKGTGKPCSFSRALIEAVDEKGELVVWYRPLVEAEELIAERLAAFNTAPRPDLVPLVSVKALELGYALEPEQQLAVETALMHPVSIVTGGPGTGKSYLLKVLLKTFDAAGAKVMVSPGIASSMASAGLRGFQVAPTGKAAKRISEATGREAKTVHSLIGFSGGKLCAFDQDCPLPAKYLVVDEASMMDTELMAALLNACDNDCRIIIVGDVDQLPSVGPGQVLRDMIRSGLIAVTRLTKARRFSGGIAEAASKVRVGVVPESTADGQFTFVDTETPAQALIEAVKELLAKKVNPDDIQILAPTHKGDAGCVSLNQAMQALLNPEPSGLPKTLQRLRRDDGDIRINDRVIQTKNDKELKIVNGDVGYIESIDSATGKTQLGLPDRDKPVLMEKSQTNNLKLAYAITVHKSQGAEAPYILLALDPQATFMLTRALVYTGITRGKVKVMVFSSFTTFTRAVRKGEPAEGSRRTSLLPKLQAAFAAVGKGPIPTSTAAPASAIKESVSPAAAAMLFDGVEEDVPF
ncbi:AAA family ATPase [Achromobacter xylosoxidans]